MKKSLETNIEKIIILNYLLIVTKIGINSAILILGYRFRYRLQN